MARMPRAEVLDPSEINVAHVFSRVCRRCFLLGDDPVSGKNFDHRKVWIEESLRQFAAEFGIDLLGFAILSNHFHLILRSRPDIVASWSDEEVARRWMKLCPHRRGSDGKAMEPSEPEIRSIAGCPVKTAEIRSRLSNISWWMRLLCQRIAMRANREDGETGRFWQDRYKATKLVDEASLLACAAYVDLNPIRAAMAQSLEGSNHTSVQRRIEAITDQPEADASLAPLSIDEASDPIGPQPSVSSRRCSDKGFLAMTTEDYLQLLDWTARQVVPGKAGRTDKTMPPVLKRIGLDQASWCELVRDFGKLFCSVAGRAEVVDAMRSARGHRRFHLRRRARELMTS